MTPSLRHEPPYDTHHGVVINRVKFHARMPSSFNGVKQKHSRTEWRFMV